MRTQTSLETITRLVRGQLENPHQLLGPHVVEAEGRRALAVRTFLPNSAQAWVVDDAQGRPDRPMRRIHPAGLYEAICPLDEPTSATSYRLLAADERGERTMMHDPYAFSPSLTEYDLYLAPTRRGVAAAVSARSCAK